MFGLADISLFESVTNCRCAVFNDTYTDVVTESDPLATHQERVLQLVVDNPIAESSEAPVAIVEKTEEPSESEQKYKVISRRVFQAYHIVKAIDAYVDGLCSDPDNSEAMELASRFTNQFEKRVAAIKDMTEHILGNIAPATSEKKDE